MNQELLIQQTKVESQALEHITRALEVMLGWAVNGDGFARKLSSVRFFTELYQRHLERMFALEEIDGYMESVSRLHPELAKRVDHLEQEHEQFRAAVRKSVVRIDLASPAQKVEFDATCKQLRNTINQVLEHLRRESELLVESVNRDTGGEG
jgi:hemerythrin-like domain-containing protein